MARNQSTKLLTQAVKPLMADAGFVAGKSGRDWYRDNGWYLSLIEFQAPHGWQGSYLNVAATFLWTPDLTDEVTMFQDYGGRVGGAKSNDGTTLEYTGDDELFSSQCQALAGRALQEAEKLEALRDWGTAKQVLLPHLFSSDQLWGNWNRAMLCFVTGDSRAAQYLQAFAAFESLNNNDVRRFVSHQSAVFQPLLNDFPAAQTRIGDAIAEKRQKLRAKHYPGLDPNWCFQAPPLGSIPELPVEPTKRQRVRGLFGRGKTGFSA